ncbi:cadherin-like domain-containing protein [Paenibacillus hexagrammi]|uniref:Cadherin-like domain-containing protein n=1 Tax=Paenibacillus hexagrammi TaxID=2908839 RepID=A0ABY3SK66_9BACL|nr:Ig-like domain-containing protein [Paenibacillus sp. YPD9-1]UJF33606.1 cadherin-like domain-containing protein [Paenibacillus sp. YPD9-1]
MKKHFIVLTVSSFIYLGSQAALPAHAITVPANDPIVTTATIEEDSINSSGLVITADASNGGTTNFYKITGITGGVLYKNDETTTISNGDFITLSEGQAGLKFRPDENAYGTSGFGFDVQAATTSDDTGLSSKVPASITVTEVNDSPTATNDTLDSINEDSTSIRIPVEALLANDSAGPSNESAQELTAIPTGVATGGTIFQDGSDMVFTPTPNYNGPASFGYQITDNGTTDGLPAPKTSMGTVSFTIDSIADIPTVSDASTEEDSQSMSGLQIERNSNDGIDVQYFKISNIQGGTLYKNDGSWELGNNSYITVSEGEAGLKFTPLQMQIQRPAARSRLTCKHPLMTVAQV